MDNKAAPRAFYKLFSTMLLASLVISSMGDPGSFSVRAQVVQSGAGLQPPTTPAQDFKNVVLVDPGIIVQDSLGHITTFPIGGSRAPSALATDSIGAGCAWYTGGPGRDGLLRSMVVDPLHSQLLYTVGSGGGMFRSLDRGASWSPLNNGAEYSLVGDPKHSGILYAGRFGYSSSPYLVVKITNGGASYSMQRAGDGTISGIGISPSHPQILYAIGFRHIYKTTNGGDIWDDVWFDGSSGSTGTTETGLGVAVHPTNPDVALVGTASGYENKLMKTSNGGATWYPTGLSGTQVTDIQFDSFDPNVVYASTLTAGIQKSTDMGETWTTTTGDLPSQRARAVAIDPNDHLRLYATLGWWASGGDIYTSDDGGDTWSHLGGPPIGTAAFDIAVDSRGLLHVATWQGGVWSCDPGNITALKPPVVLVHGYLGAAVGEGDNCSRWVKRYDGSSDVGNVGMLAEWFSNDYDVWIAHITTSSAGTPSLEANGKCLADQLTYVASNNPRPITIIAHSMGGLVGRVAIRGLENPGVVDAIYTLGTPNAGLPTGVLSALFPVPGLCIWQRAVCQMDSTQMASSFNVQNENVAGIAYNFVGGDAGSGWLSGLLKALGQGPNDGLVGQYSSVGWVFPGQEFAPSSWTYPSPPRQYFTHESHPAQSDPLKAYYGSPGAEHSASFSCLSGLMQDPPNTQSCESAQAMSSVSPRMEKLKTLASDPVFSQMQMGHLDAGAHVSLPITADTTGPTSFYLTWKGSGSPSFSMLSPDMVQIDPEYADLNPLEVAYEVSDGGPEGPRSLAYHLQSGSVGTWLLSIGSLEEIDYGVFVTADSSIELSVGTDASTYHPGDVATITAHVVADETGVPGATVSGILTRADGTTVDLVLTDLGDGLYGAECAISEVSGLQDIRISAHGNYGGVDFARQAGLVVGVAPGGIHLPGSYSVNPTDENGDGFYETLELSAEVDAVEVGNYAISADLFSDGQPIAHSGSFVDLVAGTQEVRLSFDGNAIRRSGLDGPYQVRHLSLVPSQLGILAASEDAVMTTEAFDHEAFGDHDQFVIFGNAGIGYGPVALSYVVGTPQIENVAYNGYYLVSVPRNWSGTVTPYLRGYSFAPVSRTYSGVSEDLMGQDFFPVRRAQTDFDRDGRTDPAKFIQSTGEVRWARSSDNAWGMASLGGDVTNYVPRSDFDGDGRADPAKFVQSAGAVYYLKSSDGLWGSKYVGGDYNTLASGSDFDGDGITDFAKYLQGAGSVWYYRSSLGTWEGIYIGSDAAPYLAGSDYDGDGKTDMAKYVPAAGAIWYLKSTTGTWEGVYIGSDGTPVSGSDFDGDGKSDMAKFLTGSNSLWYRRSSTGTWVGVYLGPGTFTYVTASDFDGDGVTDPAKFDLVSKGLWYLKSTTGRWDSKYMGGETYQIVN